jgi:hypothetical protein
MRIKTWHVELFIDEDGNRTVARAILHTDDPTHVKGRGVARRAPQDADIPEIGDEVAAARALHKLADELLRTAAEDIAAIEHAPVRLDFEDPAGPLSQSAGPRLPRAPGQHPVGGRP